MSHFTSSRHDSFDYRTSAASFATVCARERRCLFGRVERGRKHLHEIGILVAED